MPPISDDLRFRAGDASLAGTLTLPDGPAPHPWAVLVPSWLPRTREGGWDVERHPRWFAAGARDDGILGRLAAVLAEQGVASLRYDPRGCGESDGSWEDIDLFTRIDDARDAVSAMRSRDELDLRRTALIGHGEGAGIALSVAIGDPAVAAVALIAPSARSLRHVLRHGAAVRERTGIDREHPLVAALDRAVEELVERSERGEPRMSLDVAGNRVGLRLAGWEQGIHTPPVALATMLHRAVVLAHGTADAWTDPAETHLLAEVLAAGGNEPSVHLLDGAGHDLEAAPDTEIAALGARIARRIEPRDLPPVLVAIEEMRPDR